jgi:DNA gyrase subunit A
VQKEATVIIKDELVEVKEKYGDARRSEIVYSSEEFNPEDFYADDQMVITISHMGYIKRTPLSEFRAQNRGGVGSKGSETRDEDFVEHIYPATMHNTMMFFTQKGKCYWLKVYEIPEGTKNAKGRAIQNLLNIDSDDVVTAYLRVKNLNDTEFINSHYVLFCTKNGVIKKTLLEQYSRPRQNGVNAITIREDDKVIEVRTPRGRVDIVLRTKTTLYVMELKLDKSAGEAMEQIDLKNYPERFALCGLPVVKVAVSFDSERCTIGDWEIIGC